MTFEIGLVLALVLGAVVLFVSELVRSDLVALLVLVTLVFSGLLEPREALLGFSNPAVVTVWAVFILSGGLQRSGVAGLLGRQVMRVAGRGEMRLTIAIMLVAASLSAFMNNVGVAALLLPVVMDIARRTSISPSRLLIPLAYGSLLGGLNTLIGTPPNILLSDALAEHGLEPFGLFDFAPVGICVTLAGVVFMATLGRRLLPVRVSARDTAGGGHEDLRQIYNLGEQVFLVRVPEGSRLAGRTLGQSRLGSVLGLWVIGIQRGGETRLAPGSEAEIRSGDRLIVEGDPLRLEEFRGHPYLELAADDLAVERLASAEIEVAEIVLPPSFLGQTLRQADLRGRLGCIVLAILRDGRPIRTGLEAQQLQPGDRLLVQGGRESLAALRREPDYEFREGGLAEVYQLGERLMIARVPAGSSLDGKTLSESRLGDAFGLGVLGIVRDGATRLVPDPTERLRAGDRLFVKGKREEVLAVEGLQSLELAAERAPSLGDLESEEIGLAEVVLAPRSQLAARTLKELHFREKFGLNVVALTRAGQIHRSNLRDMPLAFGDALLLYGSRERLRVLGKDRDFLVLTQEAQEPARLEKAPVSIAVMAAVLIPVLLGWLPIYISAVAGAAAMVLTRCLDMDEAYRSIEWRAVFLIAGMLPLGLALEQTGAAHYLAAGVVGAVAGASPLLIVGALFLLTAVGAQIMPTSAVAILMAPIALETAADLELSPYALLMTVSLSASASFLSPVAHPANTLIMGPGGYRFTDYIRVGLPLTLCCLAVVLLVLPWVWPLR